MRQLASIAWKEWHELRIFLWIAIGVFIGLPIAGGVEEIYNAPMHHFEILASPWVIALGGVLSVFIAIGASCRDFSGHLEDFWRSRPVGIVRWLLVKYAIGLLVVLAGCLLPLFLEFWINHGRQSDITVFLLFPFQWIAIYSLSFLAGCLVRRTAHAAMLGLAAMLLVYFLPLVLPPLSWINLADATVGISPYIHDDLWSILRHTPLAKFGAGMLVVATISLVAAVVAVRGDWHVDSGRKMMYGSVSAALLILFSTAGFQLGTNLPVLAQADLPDGGQIQDLQFDGQHGTIVFGRYNQHTIDLTAAGLQIGPALKTAPGSVSGLAKPNQPPPFWYELVFDNDNHFQLAVKNQAVETLTIDLPADLYLSSNSRWPRTEEWQNRLYVYSAKLLTFDITDRSSPRLISDTPFNAPPQYFPFGGSETAIEDLPQLPDVPPAERLQAALSTWREFAFNGEILINTDNDALFEYRLTEITDTHATFNKIGEYKSSMLEQLFGRGGYYDPTLQGGLLYVRQGYERGPFESVIAIFDTAGPRPLRPIGHFAARAIEQVRPLADGKALVIGKGKIWLVGTPVRR